jgi:hypothetical protein
MVVTAATNCSAAATDVADDLAARRRVGTVTIRACIERAIADGELPAKTNADVLASFSATVLHGLSVAARDGTSRDTLLEIADAAMKAWN